MTAPFYTDKIKYLQQNMQGNDYVIGDIHGRYDLVKEALQKVNFDFENDRLLCVGDLIDRGEYSELVGDFLKLPYVYAVRGNHEDMLLDLYAEETEPSEELLKHYSHQIGLSWWLNVKNENRQIILNLLRQLPLLIEVDSKRGKVGLVHADIPANLNWSEFKLEIENNNDAVITEALWGRKRLSYNISETIEDIGRVYVGHTVQSKIKKLGNVVAIDTGAVFNQHLTIAEMCCKTNMIMQTKQPIDNVQVINSEDKSLLPFGTGYLKN